MAKEVRRFLVSGRVQGVFFRASTRAEALRLDVTGFAKNLPDGRVEVLAVGSTAAVNELEKWLWQGPPAADVKAVQRLDVDASLDQTRIEQLLGFGTH